MNKIEQAERCLHTTIQRYWRFRDNPEYNKERLKHHIEVAERWYNRQLKNNLKLNQNYKNNNGKEI